MAINGYRVTEDGQSRITEATVFRVTERFFEGTTHLTSTGTLETQGLRKTYASFSGSGSSSVTATATRTRYAASLTANSSSLNATAFVKQLSYASLVANSSTANFGYRVKYAYFDGDASSNLGSSAIVIKYGQIESGTGSFERNLETGTDTRITEDGNVRYTDTVSVNTIEGSLICIPHEVPFNSVLKIKRSGLWKTAVPYVKHNSTWKSPLKIHKNINGIWKRIY